VGVPPPDTVEGLLYALPQDRYVVDARHLAAILGDVTPAPRVSPWYDHSRGAAQVPRGRAEHRQLAVRLIPASTDRRPMAPSA
jgi:hypothetical protein